MKTLVLALTVLMSSISAKAATIYTSDVFSFGYFSKQMRLEIAVDSENITVSKTIYESEFKYDFRQMKQNRETRKLNRELKREARRECGDCIAEQHWPTILNLEIKDSKKFESSFQNLTDEVGHKIKVNSDLRSIVYRGRIVPIISITNN